MMNNKFEKSIEDNIEYIENKKRLEGILQNFTDIQFMNNGLTNKDDWKCNMYTIILNKISYNYYEGIGILRRWNIIEDIKNKYSYSYQIQIDRRIKEKKLKSEADEINDVIFHGITALLTDANSYLNNKDVEEFCAEFGYTDTVANYKKGEEIYRACKDTYKKLKSSTNISDIDIEELYNIISL